MTTGEMQKTSDEIRDFMKNAEDTAEGPKRELPLESMDDFSTLPIGFEESSAVMLARTEDLFAMSTVLPRHSAKYLETCTYLEKGIRALGSACITRIVVEKAGKKLPLLHQLSTHKLFGMASFNFSAMLRPRG